MPDPEVGLVVLRALPGRVERDAERRRGRRHDRRTSAVPAPRRSAAGWSDSGSRAGTGTRQPPARTGVAGRVRPRWWRRPGRAPGPRPARCRRRWRLADRAWSCHHPATAMSSSRRPTPERATTRCRAESRPESSSPAVRRRGPGSGGRRQPPRSATSPGVTVGSWASRAAARSGRCVTQLKARAAAGTARRAEVTASRTASSRASASCWPGPRPERREQVALVGAAVGHEPAGQHERSEHQHRVQQQRDQHGGAGGRRLGVQPVERLRQVRDATRVMSR